jgi:hypothetical protein
VTRRLWLPGSEFHTELAIRPSTTYQVNLGYYHWTRPCHLEGRILSQRKASQVHLLTYIPDETVDDLENLRCGRAGLVVGQSI